VDDGRAGLALAEKWMVAGTEMTALTMSLTGKSTKHHPLRSAAQRACGCSIPFISTDPPPKPPRRQGTQFDSSRAVPYNRVTP